MDNILQPEPDVYLKSSLGRDTLWYGGAVFAERLCSFFIIPILTKNLPKEFYGVWTQIIITVGLFSPIVLVGFYSAAVRFLAGEDDTIKVSNIFHGMAAVVLALCIILSLAVFLFKYPLSRIMFGNEVFVDFVWIFAGFLFVDVLFELSCSFLRARGGIKQLSFYYFIKNAIRLLFILLGIIFLNMEFSKILWLILASHALLIIFIYVNDILKKVGFHIEIERIPWQKILLFSLPLVPYTLFIWGNNFSNRYFLLYSLGLDGLSVYALVYSLASVFVILYGVISFTLYPYLTKLWDAGDKEKVGILLGKIVGYYLFLSMPIVVILVFFKDPIIRIVSTTAYLCSWPVALLITLAINIFGIYELYIYPILLKNKTALISLLALISLTTNIMLNILFIPKLGMSGAALAAFISNALLAILTIYISSKYLPSNIPWGTCSRIALGVLLMCLFLFIIRAFITLNNTLCFIFSSVFSLFIYYLFDLLNKGSLLRQIKKIIIKI